MRRRYDTPQIPLHNQQIRAVEEELLYVASLH